MIYVLIGVLLLLVVCLLVLRGLRSAGDPEPVLIGIPEQMAHELLTFLEQADDAYIRSHEMVQIAYFSRYASSTVCSEVLDAINNKPPKLFGVRKHRQRTWIMVDHQTNEIVMRKELAHKRIEIKKGIRIGLGDDLIELWRISLRYGQFQIVELTCFS